MNLALVQSAIPRDAAGKASKPWIDWETIEREYRAGVLSRREIAMRHDVSEGAIRKRAKRDGLKRDLTARVQEKVRMELVRTQVRNPNARTDQEIVDEASQGPIAAPLSPRLDDGAHWAQGTRAEDQPLVGDPPLAVPALDGAGSHRLRERRVVVGARARHAGIAAGRSLPTLGR